MAREKEGGNGQEREGPGEVDSRIRENSLLRFLGMALRRGRTGAVANQRPYLADSAQNRALTRKSRETPLPWDFDIILYFTPYATSCVQLQSLTPTAFTC